MINKEIRTGKNGIERRNERWKEIEIKTEAQNGMEHVVRVRNEMKRYWICMCGYVYVSVQ